MSQYEKSFQSVQRELTASIRNPEQCYMVNIEKSQGIEVYQELVFNNLNELLRNAFPILHHVLSASDWRKLIKGFLKDHYANTPLFYELPKEFIAYLRNHKTVSVTIMELAHFEWVELALELSPCCLKDLKSTTEYDLTQANLILSPLAYLLHYEYPVHTVKTSSDLVNCTKKMTYLIAYRDQEHFVGFVALNAVTARMLEILKLSHVMCGEALLKRVIKELRHPYPDIVIKQGWDMLAYLKQKEIIRGMDS